MPSKPKPKHTTTAEERLKAFEEELKLLRENRPHYIPGMDMKGFQVFSKAMAHYEEEETRLTIKILVLKNPSIISSEEDPRKRGVKACAPRGRRMDF